MTPLTLSNNHLRSCFNFHWHWIGYWNWTCTSSDLIICVVGLLVLILIIGNMWRTFQFHIICRRWWNERCRFWSFWSWWSWRWRCCCFSFRWKWDLRKLFLHTLLWLSFSYIFPIIIWQLSTSLLSCFIIFDSRLLIKRFIVERINIIRFSRVSTARSSRATRPASGIRSASRSILTSTTMPRDSSISRCRRLWSRHTSWAASRSASRRTSASRSALRSSSSHWWRRRSLRRLLWIRTTTAALTVASNLLGTLIGTITTYITEPREITTASHEFTIRISENGEGCFEFLIFGNSTIFYWKIVSKYINSHNLSKNTILFSWETRKKWSNRPFYRISAYPWSTYVSINSLASSRFSNRTATNILLLSWATFTKSNEIFPTFSPIYSLKQAYN